MTLRLATIGDLAQIQALAAAGPLVVLGALRAEDVLLPGSITVVNVSGPVVRACVVADMDDSSKQPILLYRLVMGSLLAVRDTLKEIAVRGAAAGFTHWAASIWQDNYFDGVTGFDAAVVAKARTQNAVFRRYLESRWPYTDAADVVRAMGDTLAQVQVQA